MRRFFFIGFPVWWPVSLSLLILFLKLILLQFVRPVERLMDFSVFVASCRKSENPLEKAPWLPDTVWEGNVHDYL